MTYAERVFEYSDLPVEPPSTLESDPTAGQWPREGRIEFRGVSMRYREHLPLALDGVGRPETNQPTASVNKPNALCIIIMDARSRSKECAQGSAWPQSQNSPLVFHHAYLHTIRRKSKIIRQRNSALSRSEPRACSHCRFATTVHSFCARFTKSIGAYFSFFLKRRCGRTLGRFVHRRARARWRLRPDRCSEGGGGLPWGAGTRHYWPTLTRITRKL
jgi:hypothetical protein